MSASFLRRPLLVAVLASAPVGAACAGGAGPRLPNYDVRTTCASARQFSEDFTKNDDYKSCAADEMRARRKLAKIWSSYNARQKKECLEPGPDKSYVETLTCLQLNSNGGHGSDIGGPVAPGLDFK